MDAMVYQDNCEGRVGHLEHCSGVHLEKRRLDQERDLEFMSVPKF